MRAIISIHALVKRATYGDGKVAVGLGDFNPRPRKEGDSATTTATGTDTHFNPRPRKEGDGNFYLGNSIDQHFNPRPRKEGDHSKAGL